jgi:hypothetical protein
MIENERFGLVFSNNVAINSGTGLLNIEPNLKMLTISNPCFENINVV